ncbi:MAG: acetylglutamate kinase [Actinobacteria bacterium]|nr:acetylglutamate kinase [Actinomycetota bacterium]
MSSLRKIDAFDAATKTQILTQALPYIRRWSGRTVVVKVGGEIIEDEQVLDAFATDIVLMRFVGMQPVIVHGGGPQISETMRRFGKEPVFSSGNRVTDAETVEIVKMVLLGTINSKLVSVINAHGGRGAGISGEDGGLLVADRIFADDGADIGFVGEVAQVERDIIDALIANEFIPIVAPVGTGPGGAYNINADRAAGAIAGALGAEKVVFLTNVAGLYHDLGDEDSLISQTDTTSLAALLGSGSLSAGMIPKIQSVIAAIDAGVPQAHILDGRQPHALLLEIFTDEGVGTMVTK